MEGTLTKRSDKVMFYGVPGTGGAITYYRATGFTDGSQSKNPKEYSRQYIDEESERADVVGYAPSISYGLDYYAGNTVHEDIVGITNGEKTGTDAVRSIVIADVKTGKAIKRDFTVIPDSEGDSTDAYTYSGTFKANGEKVDGTAASTDDWQTITFTESGE